MKTRGLQKIDSTERIDFEIEQGDVPGFVVGRLRGAMDNQIEPLGAEKRFQPRSVADVDIMVGEVLCYSTQSFEVPGGVAGFSEKDLPHVVIDAMDLMALTVKVLDRFGAN
jgi:hypothetical protein